MKTVLYQPWPAADGQLHSLFLGNRARSEGSVLANLTTVANKEDVHEFEYFKAALVRCIPPGASFGISYGLVEGKMNVDARRMWRHVQISIHIYI
jgi:hypothetical protein